MLKNYWYAAEFAHEIGDTPRQVRLFDQDIVLWRDADGQVIAQSDLCIHRGGALSGGKVSAERSCVVCPYHGWQFGTDGACVKIPANRAGSAIPKKARIDTYPCVERYGYVFVFLGDLPEEERPPVPPLDELDVVPEMSLGDMAVIHGEFHWNANYERVIENAVDIAHAPFVHGGSFGNPEKPEVDDYDIDETHDGEHLAAAVATVFLDPQEPQGIWKLISKKNVERPPVKTRTGIFFPNVTMLEVTLPMGVMKIFTAVIPVDDEHSISKWFMLRSFFTGKWADRDSFRRTNKIFLEDQPTVEGQRPELVPFDLSAELHVKSDATQLAYRRWRQAGIDRGWSMEPHRVDEPNGKRIYRVIPSPARRGNPELENAWVLKEIQSREARRDADDVDVTDPTTSRT